jgi:hypothetical protein
VLDFEALRMPVRQTVCVVGHIDLRPAQEHAARRWLKRMRRGVALLAVGGVLMVSVVVRRFALIIAVALASVLCITPGAGATRRSIDVEAIGHPIWKPVDCHLFSAAIGTAATGYSEYLETLGSLLPPPRHVPIEELGIGPGSPHRPPYNHELDKGIGSQDLHEGTRFRPREFSAGQGVFLACMVVPRPGTRGSSPDSRAGRIVPNRLFPIDVEGTAYRNLRVFDENFDFQVPPLTPAIEPRFDVDGHSHFPVSFVTNFDFRPENGPPISVRGWYRYDITLIDTRGNGWTLKADFVVAR